MFYICACSMLVLPGCSGDKMKEASVPENDTLLRPEDTLPLKAAGDTFTVNTAQIVFVSPTDKNVADMMAQDSEAFYTVADDDAFYNSQLVENADSLKIASFATNAAVLDFQLPGGRHCIVDRSKLADMEFVTFLFNGADTPHIADIDIDKAYLKAYFKK